MGEFRQTTSIFLSTLTLSVLGLSWAAQAQNSPFAKKGKQAWERTGPSTTPPPVQPPHQTQAQPYQYPVANSSTPAGPYTPTSHPKTPPANSAGYPSNYSYSAPKPSAAPGSQPANLTVNPNQAQGAGSAYPNIYAKGQSVPAQAPTPRGGNNVAGTSYDYPNYNRAPSAQPALRGAPSQASGAYYPGRANPAGQYQGPIQTTQAQGAYYPPQSTPSSNYPRARAQNRSWGDKLGFGNVEFNYEGYLNAGAAATYRDTLTVNDSWGEDFILDGSLRGEISAITQGGLEYGVAAELRGQYDHYRRGFGGRVGDCPAGVIGCNSVNVGGVDNVLRGHTSRFYTSGVDDAKDFEAQLESAHVFLRSAYGDVTVGRDDGSAYLFSLGAPTLLGVGASNNSVDYTGLDAVKTLNDASGFSEKITYTSPRLLGDSVGVGVQFGASYALDAESCGVDYCVRGNEDEPVGVLAPDIEDVIELGVALDRKFANGFSVEATATYAMGSEQSAIAAFDDLKSLGLAMELGYLDWTLGGSYLQSNNGLMNGDYEAMDIGLTWKPSKLGFTVGYGHATDDNVGLTSDQAVLGVSYDYNDSFRIGAGAQYVNRDVNVSTAGLVAGQNENATSVFVEGRFTF